MDRKVQHSRNKRYYNNEHHENKNPDENHPIMSQQIPPIVFLHLWTQGQCVRVSNHNVACKSDYDQLHYLSKDL